MSGIDIVAPGQFRHDLGWAMAQPFTGDHDECAVLCLYGVAGPDVSRTVAADDLPIGATWENPTGEFWPMNGASQDPDHPPLAIWGSPKAGDGVEVGANRENRLLAQHRW
jgi:hypothetical protein